MNKLFENWRKFVNEETAAFHGVGMEPEDMRVSACNKPAAGNKEHGWADKQWSADDKGKGCPDFSHDKGIGIDHPDIKQAVEYLNNIMDPGDKLIAYSRGGAIALKAIPMAGISLDVVFIAPAWLRGFVEGITPKAPSGNSVIMHGTMDNYVPLAHSFELAAATGMKLFVFDGADHGGSILKQKENPSTGIQVPPEMIKEGLRALPDWRTGNPEGDEVSEQHHVFLDLLQHYNTIGEQTEPFQKKVKAKHKRMKIRLIGKGKGKHTAGSYKEKPSYERSKSSPPGG